MKKILFVFLLLFASLAILKAQPSFGVKAGYSLNDQVLKVHSASPELFLGKNHGFYVGGQFEYRFGSVFALQTAVQFQKNGATLRANPEKVLKNFASTVVGLPNFSREKYIKDNGWDPANLTEEQKKELNEYLADPLGISTSPIKDPKASIDLYSVSMPLTAKVYMSDKFALLAGVNLNYTVLSDLRFKTRFQLNPSDPEIVFDEKTIEPQLAQLSNFLFLTEYDADAKLSLNEFYRKRLSNPFTVGAHIGMEYYIIKNVGVQLLYSRGLMSNIKKPFNKTASLTNRAVSLGMVYSF